jgi:hypothetical protein
MAAKKSAAQAQVYTVVPATEYTADWTIEKFHFVAQSYLPGSALKSPEFEIKFFSSDSKPFSTKWNFVCYPGGESDNNSGKPLISIYLHLSEQTPCPVGTKIAGKFSRGTFISCESQYVDINSQQRFGISNWFPRNDKAYRIEDKLCIKCEMSFLLVGGSRLLTCNSLTDFNPLRLELADINAIARDLQAWENLKNRNVVDLGPSLGTLAFGDEGTEEACHTFPLAARCPVFRKMLTVDMLEKASGRVEMPHISSATGRQCFEFGWFHLDDLKGSSL